jgi:ferredoxin-type protein NapH
MGNNFLYVARLFTRFLFIFILLSPLFGATFFIGTYSSAALFGQIHLSDPFAGLQIVLSNPASLFTSFAISIGIVMVVYAIIGRMFCSWVCPLGLLLEITDKLFLVISDKVSYRYKERFSLKAETSSYDETVDRNIKYVLLVIILVVGLLASMPVFELFSPMAIFMRMMIFGIGLELMLIAVVVISNWVYGSANWCSNICPLGAFYSILGSKRLLRIKLQESECVQCGKCYEQACKYGSWILKAAVLERDTNKISNECTNCGDCIAVCKHNALGFSIHSPIPMAIDPKQISAK